MLILIAGVTGNIGQHAAEAALERGHKVRGLGRSPSKLPSHVSSRLESFVTSQHYYDISALESAVHGVDAIICAYAALPELALEGQLLLLRAAERADVKRFLATSWNYDWRRIQLGDEEVYDAYIAFNAHVELSSSIKPIYIQTGILAEVFFGVHPEQGFTPREDGVWEANAAEKSMDIYGTGNEKWCFTTEADGGAFAVEAVTGPNAEDGGFLPLYSFKKSLREVAKVYELSRPGIKVALHMRGSVEELEKKAVSEKKKRGREKWWEYHRLFFQLFTITGRWDLKESESGRFPGVQPTSLEKFLIENSKI